MGGAAGLVGGVAGAAIGGYFGGTYGAQVGWMIGSAAGNYYAYTRQPDTHNEGPRLEDLKVQISSYGATIPYLRGAMRITGNVIDISDLVPHTQTTTEDAPGGKGGGGPQVTSTSTTYTVTIDIALCKGPIEGVMKIWANKKLIYDVSNGAAVQANCISQMRVYSGSESQSSDAFFAALHGAAPAYLGLAHIVLEDFDVTEFGNRPPQFEFLVVADGGNEIGPLIDAGLGGRVITYDTETSYVWTVDLTGGNIVAYVTNWDTSSLITTISTPYSGAGGLNGICYATQSREVWVAPKTATPNIVIYSGTGLIITDTITDSVNWFGLLRYDPYHDRVWRCKVNVGCAIKRYDATSHALIGTDATVSNGGLGGISDVKFISESLAAVLVDDRVAFLNTLTMAEEYHILHGDTANSSAPAHMEYDSSRNRLILTNLLSGDYVIIDITALTATSHSYNGAAYHCVWMPTADKYIFIGTGTGYIQIINPTTLAVEDAYNAGMTGLTFNPNGEPLRIPNDNAYIAFANSVIGTPDILKIPVAALLNLTGIALSDVVEDICVLSGLQTSDLSVSALSSDLVDGYVISSQMSARSAIEPLQQAFYFDAAESDDIIKFVKRGGSIAATIAQDDRAGPNGGVDTDLQITRLPELELPLELDVQYSDMDGDYLVGSQYDRRITRHATQIAGITLPLAMTATKAKQCAMVNLYTAWLRQTFSWSTTRKYAAYEPTDVVSLPTASATYNVRITSKRDTSDGRIEWEGLAEDSAVYTQTGIAASSGYTPQTVNIIPNTILRLMDISLLRDQDDGNGFYAAAYWPEPGTGAQLFKSSDGGSSYSTVTSFTATSVIGTTQDALGDWTGGNIFEYKNSVTVLLLDGGALSNATELEVMNGRNYCVIGDEILGYTTATLTAANTYVLSGLLRGRRGTEWAINTHAIGETFVLADAASWRDIGQDNSEIGLERKYRAPSFGQLLSQATVTNFTNNSARLECYSPAHLDGSRNGSSDLTITWVRRGRLDASWRDLVDVPIGETSELYDVEIWDVGFSALKHAWNDVSSPSQTYTAAQQTTDGFTPGDPVGAIVYQKSSVVGRGRPAQGVI